MHRGTRPRVDHCVPRILLERRDELVVIRPVDSDQPRAVNNYPGETSVQRGDIVTVAKGNLGEGASDEVRAADDQ